MDARIKIRQAMRLKRRSLDQVQQQCAAKALVAIVKDLPIFQQSNHIAAYVAYNYEIDPLFIVELAMQQGKTIYLPRLNKDKDKGRELIFQRYEANEPYLTNQYGILEPLPNPSRIVTPDKFDLVLMPVIAFDTKGMRLGSGGGYYDQTFSYKVKNQNPPPYLLGLAFEFQKVDTLPPEQWDILLHGVATEQGFHPINSKGQS